MGSRRQPSEHFIRRLKGSSKPVPMPAAPLNNAQSKPSIYNRLGHYTYRGLEVLALLFVIPTAYVLIVDLEDRQTQRIAQAWQLVTQNAPGNSGKGMALEYLNSEDCTPPDDPTRWELVKLCGITALFVSPKKQESLSGIDLSSESSISGVYLHRVQLPGALLGGADLSRAGLRGANLSKAYLPASKLSEAILYKANLSGAELAWADLSEANLMGADLSEATFSETNLSLAILWKANLSLAVLVKANLSGTNLSEANLSVAKLKGADLSGASLYGANLSGADFSSSILLSAPPYKFVLTRTTLMGPVYDAFPWPSDAQSGGVYREGEPPSIDPALLAHFTMLGGGCMWVSGLDYVECAGA